MSTALARLAFGAHASTSASTASALSSLVKHFGASRGFHGASGSFAKAKKGAAAAAEEMAHTHSATVATGINIKKGGSDPELGADDAYPDWLWGLIEPRKTLTELEKEVEAAKLTGKYDVMDIEDVKRLVKLRRRAKIKASNAERAK